MPAGRSWPGMGDSGCVLIPSMLRDRRRRHPPVAGTAVGSGQQAAETAEPFVPRYDVAAASSPTRRRLRGVPAVPRHHADRVRDRLGDGVDAPRRRAAGRRRGPARAPVRRPGRRRCCGPASRRPASTATTLYATNAVKHFKHEVRGKRRLHKRPGVGEVEACHPWLEAEVRRGAPGASSWPSGRPRRGRARPDGRHRRQPRRRRTRRWARPVVVTYHPSAVLRADERAAEIRAALVADLAAGRGARSLTDSRAPAAIGQHRGRARRVRRSPTSPPRRRRSAPAPSTRSPAAAR